MAAVQKGIPSDRTCIWETTEPNMMKLGVMVDTSEYYIFMKKIGWKLLGAILKNDAKLPKFNTFFKH